MGLLLFILMGSTTYFLNEKKIHLRWMIGALINKPLASSRACMTKMDKKYMRDIVKRKIIKSDFYPEQYMPHIKEQHETKDG